MQTKESNISFLEQSAPHILNAERAGTPILFPDEILVDFI
jgi:hypothetical protein